MFDKVIAAVRGAVLLRSSIFGVWSGWQLRRFLSVAFFGFLEFRFQCFRPPSPYKRLYYYFHNYFKLMIDRLIIWGELPSLQRYGIGLLHASVGVDWKCRTWKCRTKLQGMKMQDLKMKDQIAWHENAGPENAGPQKQDQKMEDKLPKAIT